MKKIKKVMSVILIVLWVASIMFMVIDFGMMIEMSMLPFYMLSLAIITLIILYMKVLQVNIESLESKMKVANLKLEIKINENQIDNKKDTIKLIEWVNDNNDLSKANTELLLNIIKVKPSNNEKKSN